MAKLGIFTGTSANDTTGDTLAQGAVKINSNFSEIYNAIGDGTNITNSLSTIKVAGLSTFTSGPVLIGSAALTGVSNQSLQVTGSAYVSGNLGIGTAVFDTYTHGGTNVVTQIYNSETASDSQAHILLGSGAASQANSSVGTISWGLPTSTATNHGIAYISVTTGANSTLANPTGKIFFATRTTTDSTFIPRATLDETGNLLLGVSSRYTEGSGTANQQLQVRSGAYVSGSIGIGTTNPTSKLHIIGNQFLTGGNYFTDTTSGYFFAGIGSYAGGIFAGSSGNVVTVRSPQITIFENNSFECARITSDGNLGIGTTTATGTASQRLQVTGGAYVSGNLGIGTTNPPSKLSVQGDGRFSGVVTATSFSGSGTNLTGIVTSIVAGTNITISGSTGQVTINSTGGGGGDGTISISTNTTNQAQYITYASGIGSASGLGVTTTGLVFNPSTGNLGIGITNPTSSLSVNGSTVIGTEILNMTGLSSTFTTVENNTFVVPSGVTKISAVLIGGGGAGGGSNGGAGGNGGGGGGLVYINDCVVSPGQNLTVIVGGGGVAVSNGTGGDGGDSSITGVATAFGGKGGAATAGDNGSLGGSGGSNFANSGISNGGPSGKGTNTTGGGGGGSAGYSGNGGSGGTTGVTQSGAGSGGGAGGGSQGNGTFGGNGGGGTDILGQGSSGASDGVGGSGGVNGVIASSPTGSNGGNYGGGGGGADGATGSSQIGGNGGQGVVRIIWSPSSKFSRLFPTNQVGNNINQ